LRLHDLPGDHPRDIIPETFPGNMTRERRRELVMSVRALPRGVCWCGCGERVSARSFFVSSHDRKAESMLIQMRYGSIAQMLADHGYGPDAMNLREDFGRQGRRSNGFG
jgi:hypothetical protein